MPEFKKKNLPTQPEIDGEEHSKQIYFFKDHLIIA